MKLGKPSPGDRAWMVLALGVLAFDTWAMLTGRDTMSQSYARALEDPRRRWPTLIFWGYLTGHLTRAVPREWDPLRRFFRE